MPKKFRSSEVQTRMPNTLTPKNPSKNPIVGTGEQALDLIGNILELLSADSIMGKDPKGQTFSGTKAPDVSAVISRRKSSEKGTICHPNQT